MDALKKKVVPHLDTTFIHEALFKMLLHELLLASGHFPLAINLNVEVKSVLKYAGHIVAHTVRYILPRSRNLRGVGLKYDIQARRSLRMAYDGLVEAFVRCVVETEVRTLFGLFCVAVNAQFGSIYKFNLLRHCRNRH